jgi:hypothetical protein
VAAVRTANAGKTIFEIAAFEEVSGGFVVDRSPMADLAGVALGIDGAELVPVLSYKAV